MSLLHAQSNLHTIFHLHTVFFCKLAQNGYFPLTEVFFREPCWFSNNEGKRHRPSIYIILSISNYLKCTEHFLFVSKEKYSRTKAHIQNGYKGQPELQKIWHKWFPQRKSCMFQYYTGSHMLMSGYKHIPKCEESYMTSCKLGVLCMHHAAGCSTILKLE